MVIAKEIGGLTMVQESNNKNNSDVFLNHVEAGLEKLPTFHDEYVKMEYHECCENARHHAAIRNTIMQFWVAFSGILFVALGTSLDQLEKNLNLGLLFMLGIGVAGLVVTILVYMMEIRVMDYYKEWSERCRILEARMGFYGQYWRTYFKLVEPQQQEERKKKEKKISRMKIMKYMYWFGICLWTFTLLMVAAIALGLWN
jgi:hypothetical protein